MTKEDFENLQPNDMLVLKNQFEIISIGRIMGVHYHDNGKTLIDLEWFDDNDRDIIYSYMAVPINVFVITGLDRYIFLRKEKEKLAVMLS